MVLVDERDDFLNQIEGNTWFKSDLGWFRGQIVGPQRGFMEGT